MNFSSQPIPSSVISPFVVARPSNGDAVSVVSYAEGREEALSWQRACRVTGRYQDGILGFDCDVSFGSSGAPVFDVSTATPEFAFLTPRAVGTLDLGRPAALDGATLDWQPVAADRRVLRCDRAHKMAVLHWLGQAGLAVEQMMGRAPPPWRTTISTEKH